jgi:multicomponent Na+:H+ antiporter subunit D
MFLPAAALILLGIVLTFLPKIQGRAIDSSHEFANQSAYAQSVLENVQITSTHNGEPENLSSSIVHSCIALLLAVLLALSTVFRDKLGRPVDFTRSLELGNSLLRGAHSGHPGDYVAWMSFGTAIVGLAFLWWLH